MNVMDGVLVALALYLGVGAVFAAAFVTAGVGRVDPAARGAGWSFRLLIAPGCAAMWPVMLLKWMRAGAREGRGA